MNKKQRWIINGSKLSDQEFLLRWAELGVEAYCNPGDKQYIAEHLKRAKKRISDIIKGYLDKSGGK